MSKQVRIYTPQSSITRPGVLLGEMWKDLLSARELAWRLAVRDFRAQYRQSILGVFWIFIIPLANTITWIFLRSANIVSVSETEIPYPLYVFTGTMIWSIISESVQGPLQKLTANKGLLAKVNFPREALIIASLYQSLSNSLVKMLLMLLAMIGMGFDFLHPEFLLFPFAIISLVICGSAIGLFLSPIGLLYTDIGKGLPIVMQFLMFLSPVVFATPKHGWAAELIAYNPFSPLIVTARSWITGNETVFLTGFLQVNIGLVVLFFFGWIFYRAAMPILIERMSA